VPLLFDGGLAVRALDGRLMLVALVIFEILGCNEGLQATFMLTRKGGAINVEELQ
jgi:hypothetical protein